jgi:hypothetical protein
MKLFMAMFLLLLAGHHSNVSAAEGKASLTSFAFQLRDLDANDGVTPSLTLEAGAAYCYFDREHACTASYSSVDWYRSFTGPDNGIQESEYRLPGLVSAALLPVQPHISPPAFGRASTTGDAVSAFGSAQNGVWLRTTASVSRTFLLSPQTEVTFSTLAHVELSDLAGFSIDQSRVFFSSAGIRPPNPTDYPDGLGENPRLVPVDATLVRTNLIGSQDVPLQITLSNTTSSLQRSSVYYSAYTEFLEPSLFPPVPEPSTYAFIVLGFAVLIFGSVRR